MSLGWAKSERALECGTLGNRQTSKLTKRGSEQFEKRCERNLCFGLNATGTQQAHVGRLRSGIVQQRALA